MQIDKLSTKERAAMFALLAAARELSNPELQEYVGFRLDGKERRRLKDLGLVRSDKKGRAYAHELTDRGREWCADEFSAGPAGPGPRADSMERALYAILGVLERYTRSSGQSLRDIFGPKQEAPTSESVDVEGNIVAGYRALARDSDDFVKLSLLRERLADIPRADTDAALDRMYRAQRIDLIPQSNQRALTAAERESAVRIGGQDKHLIWIERS